MPPLPSKRTVWHSLLNPLTRRHEQLGKSPRDGTVTESGTRGGRVAAVSARARRSARSRGPHRGTALLRRRWPGTGVRLLRRDSMRLDSWAGRAARPLCRVVSCAPHFGSSLSFRRCTRLRPSGFPLFRPWSSATLGRPASAFWEGLMAGFRSAPCWGYFPRRFQMMAAARTSAALVWVRGPVACCGWRLFRFPGGWV